MQRYNRAIILLLDGVGVGELPDAADYGDVGSNTLGNLASACGGLELPNLERLGLGNLTAIEGVPPTREAEGCYGRMTEASRGKDSTSGHWEIAGVILKDPFPVYPEGFPRDLIEKFEQRTGKRVIGNRPASGTAIIEELGEEHLKEGSLIVYTSADSVFQIAAHEEVASPEELYRYCEIARSILTGEHGVARVIARPFRGKPGSFTRTDRRRDFSLPPPEETLLDILKERGLPVVAVGKVDDLFARRGLTKSYHSVHNMECVDYTLKAMRETETGLIFANFVEFDMIWGHRNDAKGFGQGLEEFDRKLPGLIGELREGDVVFITADHGNDPTTPSTDHSREYVPLIVTGPEVVGSLDLGTRQSFADLGATAAQIFGARLRNGTSFLEELWKRKN
jgi:phosphopentomutase